MFIVYYVSVTTVGTIATDWANDGVFGDGWHLFGIGTSAYEEDADSYTQATNALDAYGVLVTDDEDAIDVDATKKKMAELDAKGSSEASVKYEVEDEETLATNEIDVYYDAVPDDADEETVNGMSFKDAENMSMKKAWKSRILQIMVFGFPVSRHCLIRHFWTTKEIRFAQNLCTD